MYGQTLPPPVFGRESCWVKVHHPWHKIPGNQTFSDWKTPHEARVCVLEIPFEKNRWKLKIPDIFIGQKDSKKRNTAPQKKTSQQGNYGTGAYCDHENWRRGVLHGLTKGSNSSTSTDLGELWVSGQPRFAIVGKVKVLRTDPSWN